MAVIPTVALLLSAHLLLTSAQQWGYEPPFAPANWSLSYPTCGGQRQSPIDIETPHAVYDSALASLTFNGYDTVNGQSTIVNITNSGHSVGIIFIPSINAVEPRYKLTNGALSPAGYVLDNIHFHWGYDDAHGSEHEMDGHAYPMEVHFVHYRQDLGNVSTAKTYSDGLAVVGVFVKISETNNSAFNDIVSALTRIHYKDDNIQLSTTFNPSSLLPTNRTTFYRYLGSLTIPGCDEAVIWTVLENPITISSVQLSQFRTLSEWSSSQPDHPMRENFRPPQALNNRTVNVSVNTHTGSTTATYTGSTTVKHPSGASHCFSQSALVLALAAIVTAVGGQV